MANLVNSLMNFMKLSPDNMDFDDEWEDDDIEEDNEKERRKEEKRIEKEMRREEKRAAKEDYYEAPSPKRQSIRSANKVVPIRSDGSGYQLSIVKPSNFGDSQLVCETLLRGQPVIVNLEGIDILEAQRIMDFIAGCIFAISGNMRQVSRYIFTFTPKGIDISGDFIKNMTEGEGINIPSLNSDF